MGLVRDYLALPLEEIRDVVSEEIVGNNECFLSLLALLTRIRETVGVIVVLGWGPAEDPLFLQRQKVVDIVWQLVQLR